MIGAKEELEVGRMEEERVCADTERWLERAVIGLNLCPFAKAVHIKGQIHYAVSAARGAEQLLADLRQEGEALRSLPASQRETTLVIAPHCLADFFEFNDFLTQVDALCAAADWAGILQVATFHPDYQFAGTHQDDASNLTNRSPYPTLHLLREESIDRAVEAFPEAAMIFEKNMETMEALGHDGWAALGIR
jgi:uncharacterized protein